MRLSKAQSNIHFVGLLNLAWLAAESRHPSLMSTSRRSMKSFRLQTLDQERNVHSVTILSWFVVWLYELPYYCCLLLAATTYNILFGIKQSRKKWVNKKNNSSYCVKFKIGKIVFQSIPQLLDLSNSEGSHGMYLTNVSQFGWAIRSRNISLIVYPNI